ncbi:Glycosaminoglycan attachment site [uncultured Candidatus Thioglobus sp.]|nr:Glycosaminoglycan attachment site [uncultured Candidatus Thioglobus sp.]
MRVNLFDPIMDEEKLHPYFKEVQVKAGYEKTHDIINEWADGLLDRKGEATKFINEFQSTFNSSYWELYLNKSFKLLGFDIDYTKASPDFNLVNQAGKRISVEAVTSNPSLSPELTLDTSSINEDKFLDESTLKLSGKIRDKHQLYLGDGKKKHPYSSLEHVKGNPFIIAFAPFDRQLSQSQNNTAINRVLYGLEPPTSYYEPQTAIKSILNKNGIDIDLGIFTNDSYKETSAVIFSTTGTFGKAVALAGSASFVTATRLRKMGLVEFLAKEKKGKIGKYVNKISDTYDIYSERVYSGNDICGYDVHICDASDHKETHLDGLQIYHNPYAIHPLSVTDFNADEVIQYFYDIQNQTMSILYNDNTLVSRSTVTSVA